MGSATYDQGRDIAVDGSGNVYVAGYKNAALANDNGLGGDGFVAKVNSSGALQWEILMGSSDSDYCLGIAVDGSDNVYVAGYSGAEWGTPVNPYSSGWEAFAAKFSGTSSD